MKKKINILLVDDHPMFLNGLSAILADEDRFQIVGQANSGEQALAVLQKNAVDILVTDISMPGMDGMALYAHVNKRFPKTKTLILSTHSDPEKIEKLTKSGIDGYLIKNSEKSVLLEALRSIGEGRKYFSEEVKDSYAKSFFKEGPKQESIVKLSRREKEVLVCLTQELTAREVAEALFISINTVNTHKKNLMAKLRVKSSTGLIKYAIENGLIS